MTDPVVITLRLDFAKRLRDAIITGLENAVELLQDHDARLGRTTRPNKATAELYERDIAELRALLSELHDQGVSDA